MTTGLGIVSALIFVVIGSLVIQRPPKKCDVCHQPIKRKYYKLNVLDKIEILCPTCNSYRSQQISRAAARARFAPNAQAKVVANVPRDERRQDTPPARQTPLSLLGSLLSPSLPPLSLLSFPAKPEPAYSEDTLVALSLKVEQTLTTNGIEAKVVGVYPGPVITTFELDIPRDTRASQVTKLEAGIARGLSVHRVRVIEQIPGKSVIGLEVPNAEKQTIHLSEVLSSTAFDELKSPLALALGKDVSGSPVIGDPSKMQHLLLAGMHGSGKSTTIDSIVLSLLYKARPHEVRLILIDPTVLTLSAYAGIPHLLAPVVTDPGDAINALRWCVAEMERRFKLLTMLSVRSIADFNKMVEDACSAGHALLDPLFRPSPNMPDTEPASLTTWPHIVVIIDEFSDLLNTNNKTEELIVRLGRKAPLVGLHLVLTTRHPSEAIDGLIKTNFPARIAFQVEEEHQSQSIIDQSGAECLLGHGDMLYLPAGEATTKRIHGPFVDDSQVQEIVSWLRSQATSPRF